MLQGVKMFAKILFFFFCKGCALSPSVDMQSLAAVEAQCLRRRRHFKEEEDEEEEDPLRGSSEASPASGLSAATGQLTG